MLCFLMLLPTQGMTALAEAEHITPMEVQIEETLPLETEGRIEETLPLEPVETESGTEDTEQETEHIQETLPLEPLEGNASLDGITAVYWNPGGSLPADLLATASNAETATSSNMTEGAVASGNDRADGFSPQRPVKSLETALKQVDRLVEEEGVDRSDIVIYAMNPMEVPDGRMYVLNAGNVRIASWPGRTYNNDTVFYVNGGQLTLMNAVLEPGNEEKDVDEAQMIRVRGGALQLGQNIRVDGRIVMDYTQSNEKTEWEKASDSNAATSSNASALEKASGSNWTESGTSDGSFDIGSYIFSTDESEWELLEDKAQASTWREPIIELLDGFDGVDEGFLLELRSDNDKNNVTLARTLYADAVSAEEFADFFRLVDEEDSEWKLIPTSEKTAVVRDTGAEDRKRFYRSTAFLTLDGEAGEVSEETEETGAAAMTVKRLSASKATGTNVVYWNPGPEFTYNGITYPEGRDTGVDGTTIYSSVKTLQVAIEKANGGTIVVMQTLNLGDAKAGDYLTTKEDGSWLVKAASSAVIPALRVWEVNAQPIFRVPNGEKLILEDIELVGMVKNGQTAESLAIVVEEGGDLTVRENVTAETGFIQINASDKLKDHPVHADSTSGVSVTLFFSGINASLEYRYTDVVVPTDKLMASGSDAQDIGLRLMDSYRLAKANRLDSFGGTSRFDWELRPDTSDDDFVANPQNLELYTTYYYDAVYLDGVRGSDTVYAATCQYPAKTWARARQIWQEQMEISVAARHAAYAANPNITKEEMNKRHPYPNTIYICGTVTVEDTQLWDLTTYTDYDGETIRTEVTSHRDIPKKVDGAGGPVHELPTTLVEVTGGGELTVTDVFFRNHTDLTDSRTIRVSGAGSKAMLKGTTSMSGKLNAGFQQEPKDITLGIHVEVTDGGAVELDKDLTGFIESRQQGIVASGTGTTVTMDGGTIRNHDVYDAETLDPAQKRGAGVSLTKGAVMTMNGGVISENKTYLYGGGVYVSDAGSSFTMNKGTIENNTISFIDSAWGKEVYGIGIYGGEGTEVTIGTADGSVSDAKICGNKGYVVNGSGIYTNGTLTVRNAEISDNRADSSLGGNYVNEYTKYMGKGVGIYVDQKGKLQMDGAVVSGNKVQKPAAGYEIGLGAGIYCVSNLKNEIKNSKIFGNMIGESRPTSYEYARGGGIYYSSASGGTLDIENTMIYENKAYDGAGIHGTGRGTVKITDCLIEKNIASSSATAATDVLKNGRGGGISISGGEVTMTDCSVRENSSAIDGGAIRVHGGKLWFLGTAADKAEVTANTGSGILMFYNSSLYGENILISENSDSGLYNISGNVVLRKSKILKNKGEEGAGIRFVSGECTLEDVRIEDNEAAKAGGGIYQSGGTLYFSESKPDTSSLTRNQTAGDGGGICQIGGTMYLDVSGDMKNTALSSGHNIYQGRNNDSKGGFIYFLQGNLRQPDEPGEGRYNVFLNATSAGGIYIDPTKATIEKRAGISPDAVYLNTAISQMYYLKTPDTEETAVMPIDVNTDVFKVGSVLVRPANLSAVTSQRPNAALTGAVKYTLNYDALKDASIKIGYVAGGRLPRRTQLGGFQDEKDVTLTNIVLVGEGVYLAGADAGGDDANDGSSPDRAVATFEKAKEILEQQITAKAAAEANLPEERKEGFSPYIYICGNVPITGNEVWELDYEAPLFVNTNKAFEAAERALQPDIDLETLMPQVRRFASFLTKPMITVNGRAALTMDKIIVDGMCAAVNTSIQGNASPIILCEEAAVVTLTGETQVRNNYDAGINLQGRLVLEGEENQTNRQLQNIEGYAVWMTGKSAEVEMRGYSRIVSDAPNGNLNRDRTGIRTENTGNRIFMNNYSSIEGSDLRKLAYGIFTNVGKAEIHMNHGGSETGSAGSAQIKDTSRAAIYAENGTQIYMAKQSRIHSNFVGLMAGSQVNSGREGTEGLTLEMLDDSAISGNRGNAIELRALGPSTISLKNRARITRNSIGIYESSSIYCADRLEIVLADDARISGNSRTGINLAGDAWDDGVSYQRIILKDRAMIGGGSAYVDDETVEDCGNGQTGIEIHGPTSVLMQGSSAVLNNGLHGIYFKRQSATLRDTGSAELLMEGNSTIAGNSMSGVYNQQSGNSGPVNALKIVVKESASVRENENDQIFLNKSSELHLEDSADIFAGDGPSGIYAVGKIYMHGTVTVNGRIELMGEFPITLQTPIPAANQYRLYLAERFIGKEVVIPDTATLENAALYLSNYIKDDAEGLAKEKSLVADRPNIILEGENNVYLSGLGSDKNDGNSPATAVRTFHKARELLRTGRFAKGANIYICGEVTLTNWYDENDRGFDDDWSFDSDGTVTNERTGDNWTPLVKRYESYKTGLIKIPDNRTFTMKNIIVDGNKEKTTGEQLIYVGKGSVANLREGTVLQNNSVSKSDAAAVLIAGGTVNLEGGIIQGMEAVGIANVSDREARASAVYCKDTGVDWPGTFYFKSGQIRNNIVKGDTHSNGAAVVATENTSFVMNGGIITGNVNSVTIPNYGNHEMVRGAGVYVSAGKAEIRGGTIRNNTSNLGSAIYYTEPSHIRSDSRGLIISGGQISGNRVNEAIGKAPNGVYSPLYIGGPSFYLEGGGSDISDVMYLNDIRNHIIVSGDMYQSNRHYMISLNQGGGDYQFHKGSVVVAPDGNKKTDVTGYLPYFTVRSNPYVLDRGQIVREIATGGNIKESESLLLMQAVYLDGERGDDAAGGNTPKTAVRTFTRAKNIGETGVGEKEKDYYIIYVCGKTTNTESESRWSMAAPAYMCRYTGFPVYQSNGELVDEINRAYYGNLVEPQSDLIIGPMAVYGRRSIDAKECNGDSLFKIPANVTVTVEKEGDRQPVFGRNNNVGQYFGDDGLSANLSSQGGAFHVMPEGTLNMSSGAVVETEATFGSAIYLGADAKDGTKTGHLILSESPAISGTVYLDGTGSSSAAYVEPQADYRPTGKLFIALRNDYNGRECVRYPAGMTPGADEMEYYSFEDSVYALYDIVYRSGAANVIELNQKTALYLDGKSGNDSNNGTTPESAFRTLKHLYEYIAAGQADGSIISRGVAVYIVGTVTLDGSGAQNVVLNNVQMRDPVTGEKYYKGYYEDASTSRIEVDGQVYFKRYSQPKAYSADDSYFNGYGKDTMKDELFYVKDGAELSMWGIYLDGHSQDSASINRLYAADGVQAMAPLAAVSDGGILNCQYAAGDGNNIATSTLLLNNVNINKKTNQVGTLNGIDIYEGSSAGIEVREGGKCILNHAEFRNLYLGDNVVTGGTDVYHNGDELNFYNQTLFTGTVFLEGQGVAGKEDTYQTSRFLSINEYGTPAQNDFQILMRDPYKHRTVVHYVPEGSGPPDQQIGSYRLEERVKEFFYLTKRENKPWILELRTPSAVYIDGTNGDDNPGNTKAGSNPANPVRTLKRAYELLYTRAGSTIIVVDTIQVTQNTSITGNQYIGVDGKVDLGSTDKVHIVRYIEPDFTKDGSETAETIEAMGYDVPDFKGVLINVQGGNKLTVGNNVYFDGHSEPKTHVDLPREVIVSRNSTSAAPLMTVEENAVVELQRGSTLHNNNNQYDAGQAARGIEGGAINNQGTVTVAGAVFENNHAKKGDAAYQAGTFTIQSGVANLDGHSFYLASKNRGTDASPSWEDYVLQIGEQVPEGQVFDMDMDHAEAGRDVIVYTSTEGYQPASGADAEHDHFRLGSTVPDNLFLVEAEDDPAVLELQDWKVLQVEVPANIYLTMTRNGNREGSTKLNAVRNGTAELFSTPEYQIVNNGFHEVKVSVNGIENVSAAAGITDDAMKLKANPGEAVGERDLYLAVKGLDTDGNDGFTAAETGVTDTSFAAFELGSLKPGSTGTFGFTGSVGAGFVDKYKDLSFPLTDTAEEVQKYMDGSSADRLVHAKAKYLLKYKVEITPPRRQGP